MNMKYFKLKFIIPTLLIIVLGIGIGLFFIGALKPYEIDPSKDNLEFSLEGFKDINGFTDEEYNALDEAKIVAGADKDSKYFMTINEKTTIVSVYVKEKGWSAKNYLEKAELLYSSANSNDPKKLSNFNLSFYTPSNKVNTYDSNAYSIKYTNKLTGDDEHYYQLRYIDNGVDILYNIGEFLNIQTLFPQKYDRSAFEDLFIGNMIINQIGFEKAEAIGEIEKEDGSTFNASVLIYLDTGTTWSEECATYLEEKGATVTPVDSKGLVTDDPSQIAKWELSNLKDENGKLIVNFNDGINSEGSPCEMNPFVNPNTIGGTTLTKWYELVASEEGSDVAYDTNVLNHGSDASPYFVLKTGSSQLDNQSLNRFLYALPDSAHPEDKVSYLYPTSGKYRTLPVYYDYNGDGVYTEEEKFVYGGYQAREELEDGTKVWLYDEETGKPVQTKLTQDQVDAQNAQFGYTDISGTSIFQVCLRFELGTDGFKCTLLNDALKEGDADKYGKYTKDDLNKLPDDEKASLQKEIRYYNHEYKIYSIELLPYMTENTPVDATTEKGMIVLPDGSGSVISFNSEKAVQQIGAYNEKRIYGSDSTIPQTERGNFSQDLMLPLYGFVEQTAGKGLVAIVEKGAAQTSIKANFYRDGSREGESKTPNYAQFTTYLREKENVKVSSGKQYTKFSASLFDQDIIYNYIILLDDNNADTNYLDYVDVAQAYRKYLLENVEGLNEKEDTTKVNNVSVNFLGAFTKKQIALGVVYDAEKSLTTFSQAAEIVKDLKENGIESMNVVYTNWTDDEGEPEITNDISVSSALGGKKELKKLTDYLNDEGIQFFADYNLTNGYGYDFSFGKLKYSARTISTSYSSSAQYVLSTGLADKTRKEGSIISPRFYNALISSYVTKLNKYNISGLSLYDLGNKRVADYKKNDEIYSEAAVQYQINALQVASENVNGNVLLKSPYDYAVPYASYANNIPTSATIYPIVDYSVPLYQLVFSGILDYSSEYINYNNDNNITYNILKAIETGSNLAVLLSYENTNQLLDTHYTEYYNAYYLNWRTNIIQMNETLNDLGIYEGYLVDHERITDNLIKVTYSNGLEVLINYDNNIYQDSKSGLTVTNNWFTVVPKEGDTNE